MRRVLVCLVALIATGSVNAAPINFTGPYELQNWSVTGPGVTSITPSSGPSTTADFGYDLNPRIGFADQTWTFTTTAAADGMVSFDWQYDFFHAFFAVSANLDLVNFTTNQSVNLLTFFNQNFTGPQSFSGLNASIFVNAGDTFGLRANGDNFDSTNILQGNIIVSNFDAPLAPEPLSLAMFGGLAIGAGLVARKRLPAKSALA